MNTLGGVLLIALGIFIAVLVANGRDQATWAAIMGQGATAPNQTGTPQPPGLLPQAGAVNPFLYWLLQQFGTVSQQGPSVNGLPQTMGAPPVTNGTVASPYGGAVYA